MPQIPGVVSSPSPGAFRMPKTGLRVRSPLSRSAPVEIAIRHGNSVRSLTVRPWLTTTVVGGCLTFLTLYLLATGYLFFRDDILRASITRQAHIQFAYEDRIAALRAEIDRLASRQLLNQQAIDAKLEQLLTRQSDLDERQDVIAVLGQALGRAGIALPEPARPTEAERKSDKPITTGSIVPLRAGQFPASDFAALRPSYDGNDDTTRNLPQFDAVEQSVRELAERQVAFVGSVAGEVERRTGRISAVLKTLGQPVPAGVSGEESGVGGPFVPLSADMDSESFRDSVTSLTAELDRLAKVRDVALRLPLSKPVRNASITSGFGTRIDPFLGRPALHTGIDFRAATGHPIRATAGGKVIAAEYNSGYGNMVEIDHGGGITTRFGHMSRILVTVGQSVSKGTIIGKAGSTGRATGPHVHYEIRKRGQAIDPMRYIRAGIELSSLL